MERSRAWWHSRSRAFLAECAHLIESRVGPEEIEAVFLCGSFAAGDESVVLEADPPLLLSDVDLVLVVSSLESLERWGGRRAELGEACESLWGEIRFSGRVDVGVMLARDLEALPAKPGVYDMRVLGKVLAGEPGILGRIPAHAPSDIEAREAVALIENRSISLLDARPGGRPGAETEPYRFLYRIARAYTDIAAAALSVAGAYCPGYAARAERIRAGAGEGGPGSAGRMVDPVLAGKIERWTAFKLEPSIAAAEEYGGGRGFGKLWEETAIDLLDFWKRLKAGSRPRIGVYPGVWRDNAIGWKAYLSRFPLPRRIGLCASLGGRLLARSPLEAVREEGMRLLDHRVTRGAAVPVRSARGGFPYRGGSWERAVGELCAAWNGIVFGRAGG